MGQLARIGVGLLWSVVLWGWVLWGGCAAPVADSAPKDVPTFDDFVATYVYVEPFEDGVYIVDGDTPIADDKGLRDFYEELYFGQGRQAPNAWALTVAQARGTDSIWNATQRADITYCVSDSFGGDKARVVAAMEEATAAWQGVADVHFRYLPAQDRSCTSRNYSVTFDVRPAAGQPYLARAFFPNQGRRSRNVIIDSSSYSTRWPLTLTGILRHELGHAIGFRHEHTRPQAGRCFEDSNWRAVTSYDPDSVMHYPQCGGTNRSFSLSRLDGEGAAAVYGVPGPADSGSPAPMPADPRPAPPPPPPSTPPATPTRDHTARHAGSLASGTSDSFGPYAVDAGSTLRASITGTGDADLYVRFGAAPTTSNYDCRPYRADAAETCTLAAPSTVTQAWVMVRGYGSSTYDLTVTWRGEGAPSPIPAPAPGPGPAPAPAPAPAPTPTVSTASGSLTAGQQQSYAPVSVLPGTSLRAVLSGTGDADLYLRWGTAPTRTLYDCRPYSASADETCDLVVPAGTTVAHIMVDGYTTTTFALSVTHTAP